MNPLLDMHSLIWFALDDPRLSESARALIVLPIEPAHTTRLVNLPFPRGHKDPFDRLLIAQAIVEDIPIIRVDAIFDAYPVRRIW